MSEIDEEALIAAVIRVRADLGIQTAAECFTALEDEFANLTMSLCKKACTKATKRTAGQQAAAAPAPAAAAPAKSSKKAEKEQKRAEQQLAAEVKAAEATMMEMQRRLRAAKLGDAAAAVTINESAEAFIQKATQKAIAGILDEDDAPVLKERIEADITALEWVKLAQASGALSLKEDVLALGVEVRLEQLKEVRGAKDVTAVRSLYMDAKPTRPAAAAVDANAELDARVKAASLQPTAGALDEMD